ncbi:MAG: T9SS C-terminal target domain-containing protein [candidate division Zixibacteria bacterium]|nr:T9SS C-terminal target domain-containing protein [candidate division Zixibacteria bacterium]
MLRKILLSVFALILLAASVRARTTDTGKPTKNVFDADLTGGNTYNWVKDTVYVLRNFVFLESGGTLNIQAGTIVKGDTGTQANAKALIISRGANINALGTKADPIIFTSILDTVDSQTDLTVDSRGLWGGLIMLGQARISDGKFEEAIEGIPLVGGLPDPRALYGGLGGDTTTFDDNDNSGELRYVSIRHGGSVLEANNEINGLTLGGVGRGTVFNYVEVFGNADDGIEFFGGVPDIKYAVTSYGDDDGFDTDEGYRGRIQFGFRLISDLVGNNGSENDGAENPITTTPFTEQTWYNCTFIGSGVGAPLSTNDRGFHIRDNAAPHLHNSIFTEFDELVMAYEATNTLPVVGTDFVATDNIWWRFGCNGGAVGALGLTPQCVVDPGAHGISAYLTNPANNNDEVDPMLTAIGRPHAYNARVLDPRPQSSSPATSGYPDPSLSDPWFTSVTYAGAFPPNDVSAYPDGNWLCGWTALAQYGFLTLQRGDLDNNGSFSPADVVTQLNAVFSGLAKDYCQADTNCDGQLTPSDVVNELNRVFSGTPLPCV